MAAGPSIDVSGWLDEQMEAFWTRPLDAGPSTPGRHRHQRRPVPGDPRLHATSAQDGAGGWPSSAT